MKKYLLNILFIFLVFFNQKAYPNTNDKLYEKIDLVVEKIISSSSTTMSEDSKKSLSCANKEGVIFIDH